jgi:hypothetical protein
LVSGDMRARIEEAQADTFEAPRFGPTLWRAIMWGALISVAVAALVLSSQVSGLRGDVSGVKIEILKNRALGCQNRTDAGASWGELPAICREPGVVHFYHPPPGP